jgi:hypothetical protein
MAGMARDWAGFLVRSIDIPVDVRRSGEARGGLPVGTALLGVLPVGRASHFDDRNVVAP